MNVIAPESPAGPLIISILKETNVYGLHSEEASHFYRVIIRSYDVSVNSYFHFFQVFISFVFIYM